MAKEFSDDTDFDKLPKKVVKESIEYQDMTFNIVNDIINIINRTQGVKGKKEYYLPLEGETYDELDLSLSVELTISRNENVKEEFNVENENVKEEFNVDTYYVADEDVIEILIELNPDKEPRSYNHLYYYLIEYVRHEIRHGEQDLKGELVDDGNKI
jgi:hypothetical protein